MHAPCSPAAVRARLRALLGACLRSERGDTLIEVVIAALMVALIATASLGGFSDIGHLTATQRNEEQAAALAQQDEARLRGLTISQLDSTGTSTGPANATTGNTSYTQTVDGTVYTVTSTSKFISGSTGASACSGGNADVVQTTSTVTWATNNGGRNPVVVHGLITPNNGGALVATVYNGQAPSGSNVGLAGVTISLSGGPTSVTPVITDSSGCVVFAGLDSGTYTVNYTAPTGGTWITNTGSTTIPSQNETVTATQTAQAPAVYLAQPGAIQASFQTTFNGNLYNSSGTSSGTLNTTLTNQESDTFVVNNGQWTPNTQVFGTDSTKTSNSYAQTLTSSSSFFPFSSTMATSYLYFAWAGSCTANEPSPTPAGFSIAANTTTPVTASMPAMIIMPYAATPSSTQWIYDDPNSAINYAGTSGSWYHQTSNWTAYTGVSGAYNNTETDDNGSSNDSVTVTLPSNTTSVYWVATEGPNNGYATVTVSGTGGVSNQSVDLYNSTTLYKQTVFSDTSLGSGAHTLTISTTGQNGGPATYNWYTRQWTYSGGPDVSIDEIYGYSTTYGSPALMTTAPNVTVTDTDSGCSNNEDYPPTRAPDPTWGALQYPGTPYGTYTVCVDNGTNKVTFTGVKNTSANGDFLNANIYPGGGGTAWLGAGGTVSGSESSGTCT
jgi:type II secretory pathway pseudopilin PulG